MSQHVTASEIAQTVESLKLRLSTLGIDNVVYQKGSPTYGRAWRLFQRDPQTGGLSNIPGVDNYLGWTKPEVERTLRGIITGIDLVTQAQAVPA